MKKAWESSKLEFMLISTCWIHKTACLLRGRFEPFGVENFGLLILKERKGKKNSGSCPSFYQDTRVFTEPRASLKLMALSASNRPWGQAGQIVARAEGCPHESSGCPQGGSHSLPVHLRSMCAASKAQELGSIAKSLEAYEIFQIGVRTSPRVFCSPGKWKWNIWVKAKRSPDLHLISTQM